MAALAVLVVLAVLAAAAAAAVAAAEDDVCGPELQRQLPVQLPPRWEARVLVTQHQVDPELVYPPRETELHVFVDGPRKWARVDTVRGENEGQIYLRKYEPAAEAVEYRIFEGRCERALLTTAFPTPRWPPLEKVKLVGANHWVYAQQPALSRQATGVERVHFYVAPGDEFVSKVIVEFVRRVPGAGEAVEPLTTYELRELSADAPSLATAFDLAQLVAAFAEDDDGDVDLGAKCHVHGSGWPYVSLLHTYLEV